MGSLLVSGTVFADGVPKTVLGGAESFQESWSSVLPLVRAVFRASGENGYGCCRPSLLRAGLVQLGKSQDLWDSTALEVICSAVACMFLGTKIFLQIQS